jgi:hypothetical protein
MVASPTAISLYNYRPIYWAFLLVCAHIQTDRETETCLSVRLTIDARTRSSSGIPRNNGTWRCNHSCHRCAALYTRRRIAPHARNIRTSTCARQGRDDSQGLGQSDRSVVELVGMMEQSMAEIVWKSSLMGLYSVHFALITLTLSCRIDCTVLAWFAC